LSTDKNSVERCKGFTFFCRKIQNKVYIQLGVNFDFYNKYFAYLKIGSLQYFDSIVFECTKTEKGYLNCNFIKIFSEKRDLNMRDRYNVAVMMGGLLSRSKLRDYLSKIEFINSVSRFESIVP